MGCLNSPLFNSFSDEDEKKTLITMEHDKTISGNFTLNFELYLKAQNLNSSYWLLHFSFYASCRNLDYYIETVSVVDELVYSHHFLA